MPGLVMEADGFEFVGGAFVNLSFNEWYSLDKVDYQPVDYRDSRPAFFCMDSRGGPWASAPEEMSPREFLGYRDRVYRAVALVMGWAPLPHPRLSFGYVLDSAAGGATYFPGPCGKDWILTGHFRAPRHHLTADVLEEAGATLRALTKVGDKLQGTVVEAGLRAFEMAGLPEVSESFTGARHDLALIVAVAAIEQIVVPEAGMSGASITQRFADNAAALMVDSFDELEQFSQAFRQVYSLRSDLMHGRKGFDLEDERALQALSIALTFFPIVLRNALNFSAYAPPDGSIAEMLTAASESREAFDRAFGSRAAGGGE
jgi:hypothetical protein